MGQSLGNTLEASLFRMLFDLWLRAAACDIPMQSQLWRIFAKVVSEACRHSRSLCTCINCACCSTPEEWMITMY